MKKWRNGKRAFYNPAMNPKTGVLRFFEAKAESYDSLSASGLWKLVRNQELKALLSLARVKHGTSVLELGCGSGFYSSRFKELGAEVFGIDFSPTMIASLRRKDISAMCADIAEFQLEKRFPVVVGAGVLEFLPDSREFFSAARKHAAPGARLVLLAPRSGAAGAVYRLWHEWKGCNVTVRSPGQLEKEAAPYAWELEELKPAGPLAFAVSFRDSVNA